MARKQKWITVQEAADRLDLGRGAVLRLAQEGKLESAVSREGRIHILIDSASLDAFVRTHERRGPGVRGGYKWLPRRS